MGNTGPDSGKIRECSCLVDDELTTFTEVPTCFRVPCSMGDWG